jgi:hypothetical protein
MKRIEELNLLSERYFEALDAECETRISELQKVKLEDLKIFTPSHPHAIATNSTTETT